MWRTSISLCLLFVADVVSAQQASRQQPQHIPGKIIWTSPDQSTVVIRAGELGNFKEFTFEIGESTRFWGNPPNLVQSGLYVVGHNDGSRVFWYSRGMGGSTSVITELTFVPPQLPEQTWDD